MGKCTQVRFIVLLIVFMNIYGITALRVFDTCDETSNCPEGSKCEWRGCDGRKCICQNKLPSQNLSTCVTGIELGGPCKQGDVCIDVSFSKCIDSICSCVDGYQVSNDKTYCVERMKGNTTGAEYGQSCTASNVQCVFDLVCIHGKCTCPHGQRIATTEEMFAEPFNYRLCVPVDFKIGKPVNLNGPECQKPGLLQISTTPLPIESTSTSTPTSATVTSTSTTTSTTVSTTKPTTEIPSVSTTQSTTPTESTTIPTTSTKSTTTPTTSTTLSSTTTTKMTSTTSSPVPSNTSPTETLTTSVSTPSPSTTTTSSTIKTSTVIKLSSTTVLTSPSTQEKTSTISRTETSPTKTTLKPDTTSPESTTTPSTTSKPSPTTQSISLLITSTTTSTVKPKVTTAKSTIPNVVTQTHNTTGKSSMTSSSTINSVSVTPITNVISHSSSPKLVSTHQSLPLTSSPAVTSGTKDTSVTSSSSSIIVSSQTLTSTKYVPVSGTNSLTPTITSGQPYTQGSTVGLGEPCKKKACPKNSECVLDACDEARCQCKLGYANSPDEKTCWKLATLGELCGKDKVCQGANTICSDRGICECESGFERSDSGRWCRLKSSWFIKFPVVGEECSDSFSSQCYMYFEQECINGKCRCKEGYREVATIPDQNAVYPDTAQCRNASFESGEREALLCKHQSKTRRDYDVYSKAKSKIHRIQGAIIGGSVGFVALLGIVIGILVLIRWKRKGRQQMIRDTSSTASTDATSRYSFKIPRPFAHFVGSKEFDSTQIAYPNTIFDKEDKEEQVNNEPKPDVVNVGTLLRQSQNQT